MSNCPLTPIREAWKKKEFIKNNLKYTLAELVMGLISQYMSDVLGFAVDVLGEVTDIAASIFSSIYNSIMTLFSPNQLLCYSAYQQIKKIRITLNRESSQINSILSQLYRLDSLKKKKKDPFKRLNNSLHDWLKRAHEDFKKYSEQEDIPDFESSYRNLQMAGALLSSGKNKRAAEKLLGLVTGGAIESIEKGDAIKSFDKIKKETLSVIISATDYAKTLDFIDDWIKMLSYFSSICYTSVESEALREFFRLLVEDMYRVKEELASGTSNKMFDKGIQASAGGLTKLYEGIKNAKLSETSLYGTDITRVGAESLLQTLIGLFPKDVKASPIAKVLDKKEFIKSILDDKVYGEIYGEAFGRAGLVYSDRGEDLEDNPLIDSNLDKVKWNLDITLLEGKYRIINDVFIIDEKTKKAMEDFRKSLFILKARLEYLSESPLRYLDIQNLDAAYIDMTTEEFEQMFSITLTATLIRLMAKIIAGSIGSVSFASEIQFFTIAKAILEQKREWYSELSYTDERMDKLIEDLNNLGLTNFVANINDGALALQNFTDLDMLFGSAIGGAYVLDMILQCIDPEYEPKVKNAIMTAIKEVQTKIKKGISDAKDFMLKTVMDAIGSGDLPILRDYQHYNQKKKNEEEKDNIFSGIENAD